MSQRHDPDARNKLASLLGEPDACPDLADMRLLAAMGLEGVSGLLFARLHVRGDELPDSTRRFVAQILREQGAWALRMRHGAARIFASLNRAGIPFLCMRGLSLAERLYGELAPLRPQSDIDLLLPPAKLDEARVLLLNTGFGAVPDYPNLLTRGDLTLDLHSEPLGIERIIAWQHLTPLRSDHFFASASAATLAGEPALIASPAIELPYGCSE